MARSRRPTPSPTQTSCRGRKSVTISELALCTVASPTAAKRRAASTSPPSIEESTRKRGFSSENVGRIDVGREILFIEGLRQGHGAVRSPAVLGEDDEHDTGIGERRERGEPAVVS